MGSLRVPQRGTRASPLLALLLMTAIVPLWPTDANAAKPWSERIFARAFGGWEYDRVQRDREAAGALSSFVPTTETRRWQVGGSLSSQLYRKLWARAIVSGGRSDFDRNAAAPAFAGNTFDADQIDATGMLFVRDPEFGHFDLGYHFTLEDFSGTSLERRTTHAAVVEAGFFIPDQGIGPVDWDVHFTYGRTLQRTLGSDEEVDEFTVAGTAGYYFGSAWRFEAGARWQRRAPEFSNGFEDLRGTVRLSWLLPIGVAQRRFATVELLGSAGRVSTDLGGPLPDADRGAYSVGGRLTLQFPGARSLLEMVREQR